MPEMTFQVRWPDGLLRQYYSPSLVLHDHLAPGTYRVDDFRSRATTALDEASARVRAKYGFACTSSSPSASSSSDRSERSAERLSCDRGASCCVGASSPTSAISSSSSPSSDMHQAT